MFARHKSFIFIQIKKLILTFEVDISDINIQYYVKLKIPIMHCIFFERIFHNEDYINEFPTDRLNTFHTVCRRYYAYNNPQSKRKLHVIFIFFSFQFSIIL